ncbi:unnamed protein product [Tuber melanosporum]|uniref:(Perigord truffle) hypothetical protein n=1 Tax=Tuber melanosporum (strain Mel28) TaxID=656061 RepID=D5GPJ8_TUBMM|nr:uncharacterized protein GSTUM_00011878001 [Tuber melanosporum]CAZ86441.1 unnamed protein product [Tuber melanosporum]
MERNYTTAVRAINADLRKRHRSQLEVVIPCPPPKTDKNSEDFISLNFESENGGEGDDCDGDDDDENDDCDDKGDSDGYSPSEDLKTTQTSMSEEDKGSESEGGISEKTRSKRRRKDLSGRKGSAIGEREAGEEAMKAVARGEKLVTATQGIGRRAPAVTIEIKSSSSSSSGGAYQHEDEDKDSATRKAQQQQQELISTVVSSPPYLAITATSPLSLPSSTLTHTTGTNTNATFSPNPKPQLITKKTTAEILQGTKDLPQKVLRKLAKNQKRRERRRVGHVQWKASLEQQGQASIDHPRGVSFGNVSSDVSEVGEEEGSERMTNDSGDERLEINLALGEEGQVGVKAEEEGGENYISLSATKTPVFTTSRHSTLPLNSPGLSSSPSPSPTPTPALGGGSGGSGAQDGHRQSPVPIDRETVVFQLRYHATSTPPPFIHEESRPLFTSTKGITAASFRLDAKRFEEVEDPSKGITMETIVCDVCLSVGHVGRTCRLLKAGAAQCEYCGVWDKHFSNACPELPASEVSLGDYVCELPPPPNLTNWPFSQNWRKLPQTTPSPLTTTTATRASPTPLRPINANCYHCSGTEHFGDDCPFLPALSHPGIFSLSGVNDGDYASQEWLCEKQDLLAELEDKAKKPAYGRAVRPGDYDVSEEFDPFGEYRALEREKDRDKRRDTGGGGKMMMGRRRAGERSPSPPHRRGYSEFDRYRDRDRDRNWERNRGRNWCDRRSESPPVRRSTGVYYSSSSTASASGPGARYRDRGVDYSRVPPPPSIPPPRVQSPPPPPPPPPPPTSVRHPIPLRPPATLNQARRGSAARGCNSTGVGRGGGGRGLPLSSRKRGGGGGRGPR